MLRYGGYTWLLDVRDSPIQARIGPACHGRRDVHWQVDLQYIAAGAEWRRVKSWLRPTLRFCIYGFQPAADSWQDLEGQSFSSDEPTSGDTGGTLFVESTRWREPGTELSLGTHRLHFVKRRGFWFTTELAVTSVGTKQTPKRSRAEALVPALAHSSAPTPGAAHQTAALYLVEDLPFGVIEASVPANARDPAQYARSRARTLLGLDSAAEVDVGPRLVPDGREWRRVAGGDWRVRLHHGARWTHFTL